MDEFRLLGRRIRELRKKRHLTQGELAEAAGLYFKFLGGIERGTVNPTLRALKKIATALETSVADLFQYTLHAPDPKQVRKSLAAQIKRSSDSKLRLMRRIYELCEGLDEDPIRRADQVRTHRAIANAS